MSQPATQYRKRLVAESADNLAERLVIQEHVPIETLSLVAQTTRNFVQYLVRSEAKIPGALLLPFVELVKATEALQDKLLDLSVERERIETENERQASGERLAQMLNEAGIEES